MHTQRTTYLSFWDVELGNLPTGIFRQRDLSTAEARDILRGARISKSLICVSRKDLGAPYENRARQRHEELCAVLREHADIEMHLRDFFGELCVNPSCLAKVTNQSRLLVVDCHYVRDHQESSDAGPPESDVGGEPIERLRSLLRMKLAPESLRFHILEQMPDTWPSSTNDGSDIAAQPAESERSGQALQQLAQVSQDLGLGY